MYRKVFANKVFDRKVVVITGGCAGIGRALADLRGPVFLDVPERWTALTAWLQHNGFVRQRGFARMALGAAPIAAVHPRLFVVAGPEFG